MTVGNAGPRRARQKLTGATGTGPLKTAPKVDTKKTDAVSDQFDMGAGGVANATRLAAALSAYGASAASARTGVMRALSSAIVIDTNAASEKLASAMIASLRSNKPLDVEKSVFEALQKRGPLGVAEVAAALAWRIGAAAADGADEAFVRRAGDALERFVDAGIAALATHKPVDVKDAVSTNVALSVLLSRGQTLDSAYFAAANGRYQSHFDAFTNESGLPNGIRALPQSGGATVGVSGGALQVAAHTRADLAVVVDTNPEIRDFVLIMGTAAMVLTDEVKAAGGDDDALANAIYRDLLGPERGSEAFVQKLRAAGLPEPLAARATAMCENVYAQTGTNMKQVWLTTKDFAPEFLRPKAAQGAALSSTEVADNFRHLAALARAGALLSPVVDLSDDAALERVGALLEHSGAPLKTLHLSNALEYILDPAGVIDRCNVLPGGADATVISSTGSGYPDGRMGDWHKPGINPMRMWTEPNGIRSKLSLNLKVCVNLGRQAFLPFEAFSDIKHDPKATAAEVREKIQKVIDAHYRDPEKAMAALVSGLMIARVPGNADEIKDKLLALGVAPPASPDEARAMVRALAPVLTN
jgi:hypothetical protein